MNVTARSTQWQSPWVLPSVSLPSQSEAKWLTESSSPSTPPVCSQATSSALRVCHLIFHFRFLALKSISTALFYLHKVPPRYPPQATPRRTAPSLSLQPRQSRQRGQRRRAGFPRRVLALPVLPRGSEPGAERDELELRDLDGRPRLLHDLLRVLGSA